MSKRWNVRKPTEKEYTELAEALLSDSEERDALRVSGIVTVEQAVGHIKDYYIIVIDNYVPDSPTYAGQVFEIIWGEVSCFTRLIRNSKTKKLEVLRSQG